MKVGYDVVTLPISKIDPKVRREIVKILKDRYHVKDIEIVSDSVSIGVLFVSDSRLKKLSKTVLLAKMPSLGVKSSARVMSEPISEA